MLHTAAEGETATKDNTEGGEGTGDGGEFFYTIRESIIFLYRLRRVAGEARVAIGNAASQPSHSQSLTASGARAHADAFVHSHALYTGINTSCPLVCQGTSR